jgi:hypothetical protein
VNLATWLRIGQLVETTAEATLVAPLLALRAAEIDLESAALNLGASMRAHFARRQASREEFERAAADSHEQISFDGAAPIRSIDEAAKLLEPGDFLFDLLTIERGVSVTGVGHDGSIATTFLAWPRADRLDWLDDWTIALRKMSLTRSADTTEQAAILKRLGKLAEVIDAVFWGPLAEMLARSTSRAPRRLLVIPHRELSQFPYWHFSRRYPDVAVSIIPCTEALFVLKARRRDVSGLQVAFGDASLTLPGARRESTELPGYELRQPTKELILGSLRDARSIHFACHGRFDATNAYRSGLIVAAGESSPLGPTEIGAGLSVLTVTEIVGRLHLPKCHLAVLSACRTGLPRDHPAGEFTGLPAALLIAGARNTIASLWAAHDGFTAMLMRAFYTATRAGERPSAALAIARRRLASLSIADAQASLGDQIRLPEGERPFDRIDFLDAFQHYGID